MASNLQENFGSTGSFNEEFTLGKLLGQGHFGEVHECIHKSTNLKYAVKTVLRRKRQFEKHLNEAKREAEILKDLKHPNIVEFLRVYQGENGIQILTEVLEGGGLIDYLTEKEYFTESDAATYTHQLVSGLAYLHNKSIVHQDIKPDNIVIVSQDDKLRIKLIDFGLARKCEGSCEFLSMDGTTMYSPPEVLNYELTDMTRDLWSVGVCTYVLLSGFFPFNDENQLELIQQIVNVHYEFCEEFVHLTADATDFISKLLLGDRKARLTAKDALEHAWLKNSKQLPEKKIDTVKLKNFKARMKWRATYTALSVGMTMRKYIEMKHNDVIVNDSSICDEVQ